MSTELSALEKLTVKQLANPTFAAQFLRKTRTAGIEGFRAGYQLAITLLREEGLTEAAETLERRGPDGN